MAKSTGTRAALYARYSSDIQKDRSIEDQFSLCENFATKEGLTVVATFNDRARTSATMFDRDGLLELRRAAERRDFDVVIVENLDRISRDGEDLAGIYKRFTFYGVEIRTVNEGTTTSMHVGIRGLLGSMFLADLGHKVRRGLDGQVREGKFPGTVTYGYRSVPGKPGERVIDDDHAKIVRRIFTEYAAGISPRVIAAGLTNEGIPTPGGARAWNHQSFCGGHIKHGMIGNKLYIGEIEWNATRTVMNPDTGSRTKRAAPKEDLLTVAAPHLRIVDQPLWEAANRVRYARAKHKFGPEGKTPKLAKVISRHNYLTAGLLRCGTCGGHMIVVMKAVGKYPGRRVACAVASQNGTCEHRKTYDLDTLQSVVIDNMQEKLVGPEMVQEAKREFHRRWAELQKTRGGAAAIRKQLNRAQVQIDRIVSAIRDSDIPIQELTAQLRPLEAERSGLAERLRLAEAEGNVVELHPKAMDAFKSNVERLHEALSGGPVTPVAKAAFRNLIDSIVVHPTGKRMPYEVDVYGRLGAFSGINLFPENRSAGEILKSEGILNFDNGNPGTPGVAQSKYSIIALGRWRQKVA